MAAAAETIAADKGRNRNRNHAACRKSLRAIAGPKPQRRWREPKRPPPQQNPPAAPRLQDRLQDNLLRMQTQRERAAGADAAAAAEAAAGLVPLKATRSLAPHR